MPSVELSGGSGYVILPDGSKIPFSAEDSILLSSSSTGIAFEFSTYSANADNITFKYWDNCDAYDLHVYTDNVYNANFEEATGTLFFQQTANSSQNYDLKMQTVTLGNSNPVGIDYQPVDNQSAPYGLSNRNLYGSTDNAKFTMILNDETKNYDSVLDIAGKVNTAKIFDFNLFPTFMNWYIDNITLIPLTLVTAVFGGVALIRKKDPNRTLDRYCGAKTET